MNTATATRMSAEEFLALPDDGTDRELIRGEIEEKGMTYRNRFHGEVMIRVGTVLQNWTRAANVGWRVLGGEAGFLIERDPDTAVGIDVAVITEELYQRQSDDTTIINGVPTLAVEILSPTDTQREIHRKINLYLANGIRVMWVIDPDDRTVKVFRPAQAPYLVNEQQCLTGGEALLGFETPVGELFPAA